MVDALAGHIRDVVLLVRCYVIIIGAEFDGIGQESLAWEEIFEDENFRLYTQHDAADAGASFVDCCR